jgi:hypothetical protein
MHTNIKLILCACLGSLLIAALAACTPPPDIMDGFDENGEKTPHVDTSPPAADRHKDPNAPQPVEWQRERMLHHQGYYYFWQDETISPASIDDILIDLEQIRSTVPRTVVPIDNLQTNFGFVGYTVYRNEEHPEYFYIMDNGIFHVLYSPQRANKGFDMPNYIFCNDRLLAVDSTVRDFPLPDYYSLCTEVGVIASEVGSEEYPRENLTTNCGFVGGKVFLASSPLDEGYILLEDGYVSIGIPWVATPSIRYKGATFCTDGKGLSAISDSYQKVGAVLGVVPGNVHATKDFYCNFGAIGCAIYASKFDAGTIYVLIDGMYYPYTLPGTYS